MTTTDTQQALDQLIQTFLQTYEQYRYPVTPYDPEWPSPCYRQEAEPGIEVSWQPIKNSSNVNMFERLCKALEVDIHPSVIDYYGSYWSDPLPCRMSDGRSISLLFAWSEADLERLRANLIGHALSKQKQKRPLTFFFAVVEPDTDEMISIDNETGSIWLENPGKSPHLQIAPDMASFLRKLTPCH